MFKQNHQEKRNTEVSATIKDVAKLANVSAMTVSRAINNTGYIAPATRRNIEEAIKKLHYRPNTIARTMVTQKSHIISLIVPDIANPFFSELIKVAEAELRKHGYSLFISEAEWNIENERSFVNSSIGRMADGVIMFTPRLPDDELIAFSESIPLVVVDRSMEGTSVMDVYVDNYQGAFDATEYLIQSGHRRIGYIRGWEDVLNTKRRHEGYRDALAKYGIEYDESLVQVGDYRDQSGFQSFEYFMALPERPTAVFASNDMMAYGFMSACSRYGKKVPDDISVIGFDGINLFFTPVPALSTVNHPGNEMIRKAIYLLLVMPEQEIEEVDKYLYTELVLRDSVKHL